MFANRLRKNFKTLAAWANKENTRCYRVYDADMPEYAFAIDMYGSADDPDLSWIYVQEYAAPDSVDREAARMRRMEALSVLPEVFGVPRERVHVRTRKHQKGNEQYEKLDERGEFCSVLESGHRFLVNFTDYLDTGLFLDHRITRRKLAQWSQGRRFLNLFAYTGVATVYAVAGGAIASTTVDMSRTYLDWAKRNLAVNRLASPEHGFVHADCLQWLEEAAAARQREYDLIFLDPPTFSRSKRMQDDFDVQRDHVRLIKMVARLLSPAGTLVFSNNYTRFKLDAAALAEFRIEDISRATIPRDFERNPRIHQCFVMQRF
jgi:23S rRNA (guanine2445-N2)-methyltransferase / 23S rRNA (guanine2069-N7)-methyltransferase